MKRSTRNIGLATLAAATGAISVTGGISAYASGGATPDAVNCRKTFTSGSGNQHFQWCFSDDGNVMSLIGPNSSEHIRNGTFLEGYAICHGAVVDGFNNGNSNAGFGGASYPNATTVVRFTPNFKLTQVFTQNTAEKLINVKMTVQNITGASIANVRVSRFVDLDINGTPANDRWDKSAATIWAAEDNAVGLTATTFEVNKVSTVESFGDVSDDTGCDATTPLATPNSGDLAGRITYSIASIPAGGSRTLTFRYERL